MKVKVHLNTQILTLNCRIAKTCLSPKTKFCVEQKKVYIGRQTQDYIMVIRYMFNTVYND